MLFWSKDFKTCFVLDTFCLLIEFRVEKLGVTEHQIIKWSILSCGDDVVIWFQMVVVPEEVR
eukprot:snap_masked-scaffold_11-processed-gene-1.28-mRNA-1 protein AED:1.00 eAED:1.00 QI:0/0/0/0/1/1/2/0/61